MKTKIIPFNSKMAKDIQDGKIKGRIRTKEGNFTARIICFDKIKLINGDGITEKQIVSLIYNENAREDVMYVHNQNGEVQSLFGWEHGYDLVLEVSDNKPQFKPFDKVLVRDNDSQTWRCAIFSHKLDEGRFIAFANCWIQCIPYVGNENLIGTTDKPKDD